MHAVCAGVSILARLLACVLILEQVCADTYSDMSIRTICEASSKSCSHNTFAKRYVRVRVLTLVHPNPASQREQKSGIEREGWRRHAGL